MNQIIEVQIDGVNYKVHADLQEMLNRAKAHLQYDPEAEGFLDYSETRFSDEVPTTKEKYLKCIQQMITDISNIMEKPIILKEAIDKMGKKKNGGLKKGAVGLFSTYEQTARIWEDSYCYVMYALRCKAVDEETIELTLNESEKFGW